MELYAPFKRDKIYYFKLYLNKLKLERERFKKSRGWAGKHMQ